LQASALAIPQAHSKRAWARLSREARHFGGLTDGPWKGHGLGGGIPTARACQKPGRVDRQRSQTLFNVSRSRRTASKTQWVKILHGPSRTWEGKSKSDQSPGQGSKLGRQAAMSCLNYVQVRTTRLGKRRLLCGNKPESATTGRIRRTGRQCWAPWNAKQAPMEKSFELEEPGREKA
jgi:hypothetical protein